MLPGGHIAASYLLAQTAKSSGFPLTDLDIFGIILAGNIIDLDFFAGFLTGKTGEAHHQNITHTPLGIIIVLAITSLIFHPTPDLSLLLFFSMLLHLVLDDISYWAYKLKLIKAAVNPQINWFYPFTGFHKKQLLKNNISVLRYYLFKTWPVSLAEMVIIIWGLFIYLSYRQITLIPK